MTRSFQIGSCKRFFVVPIALFRLSGLFFQDYLHGTLLNESSFLKICQAENTPMTVLFLVHPRLAKAHAHACSRDQDFFSNPYLVVIIVPHAVNLFF
jgi:hypothetical protein